MQLQTMTYRLADRVATATFGRPDKLNSINEGFVADLEAIATAIEAGAADVAALVFEGHGKAFCVGLDLSLLEGAFADRAVFERILRRYNAVLHRIEALPVPTIAAVNGYTRAGGLELCLACDFILIADEAKIGDAHTPSAVMPGGGATQRLPRRVGEQKAKELIFTGRWLSGTEAVAYGLALRTAPLANLPTLVATFVASLIDKPLACISAAKAAINEGRNLDFKAGVEVEIRHFMKYTFDEPYAREGYLAYREGREPSWKVRQ